MTSDRLRDVATWAIIIFGVPLLVPFVPFIILGIIIFWCILAPDDDSEYC